MSKFNFRKRIILIIFLIGVDTSLIVTFFHLYIPTFKRNTKTYFIERAKDAGIYKQPSTSGVAWSDYNNDGYLDLYIASGHDQLYKNNGNGTFTDVTKRAGLNVPDATTGVVFGDYDNDGCEDIYVSTNASGNVTQKSLIYDRLYHNNCDGTFTDITTVSGLKNNYHAKGVAWADYDNDGYLDLYIVNIGEELKNGNFKIEPNFLYRNNHNGTFSDVTGKSGIDGIAKCNKIDDFSEKITLHRIGKKLSFQPVWFDFNNDGYIDLFITTDAGVSPLYKNNGDGTFTDVTQKAGLCRYGTGMGVTVGDYDNDGNLDLYVTNYNANFLWHNNGNGTFTEVAKEAGVADTAVGWGTHFFDYDNDGDLDLYVVNGATDLKLIAGEASKKLNSLDVLYENLGNGKFITVSQKVGIQDDEVKYAAAFGDYNNDGFTDIFVVTGAYPDHFDKPLNRLYQNQGNKNHWITIQLVGTKSNRDGVGAKVKVTAGGKSQIQQVISGSSYLSQNSLWLTFGLGSSKIVDTIEINWPSGIKQILHNIKAKQKIVITEEEK